MHELCREFESPSRPPERAVVPRHSGGRRAVEERRAEPESGGAKGDEDFHRVSLSGGLAEILARSEEEPDIAGDNLD